MNHPSLRPSLAVLLLSLGSAASAQDATKEQRVRNWGAPPTAAQTGTAPAAAPTAPLNPVQPNWGTSPQTLPAAPQAQRLAPQDWEQVPGCASSITAAAPDVVYVTGCDWNSASRAPAAGIYRWNGQSFQPHPGGGAGSAISSFAGSSYVVGGDAGPYVSHNDGGWQKADTESTLYGDTPSQYAALTRIATGAAGLWAVVETRKTRDPFYGIYRAEPCGNRGLAGDNYCGWTRLAPFEATRVAVGSTVWIVSENSILRLDTQNPDDLQNPIRPWRQMPGCARDLAANGDHVYAIGCERLPGETSQAWTGEVLRWSGRGWSRTGQRGIAVAVDAAGTPWFIAGDGSIWRRKRS